MKTINPLSYFNTLLLFVVISLALPAALCAQTENEPGDFQYWFDKGMLLSVYGSPYAAIQAFEKAIEAEPENSYAYFNKGVAYTEARDYEKGLAAVERAIEINPEIGSYFYGRGWIHMRAGNRDQGIADMHKAAGMTNPDARQYLERILPRN